MSFRLTSLRIGYAAAALALSGLLICSAQAGGRQRGRPIEFSAPRSDEVTTNLNQLTSKKDGLKQLEEDLYKPLQAFTPKSSLEGVVAPLPRPQAGPVIQNKRVKELLERRKNWVFMSPEDLLGGPTVERILKVPEYGADGQAQKELPALERYYQRLAPKRPTKTSSSQLKDEDLFGSPRKSNLRDDSAQRDDSNLPGGIRESAQQLKKMFEADASSDPFARSAAEDGFSDIFGLSKNAPSKEQMLEHKKFMDEYRSIVDRGWQRAAAVAPVNQVAGLPDTAQPGGTAAADLGGSGSSAPRKGLDAQSDVLNPRLGPAGLPDVNAEALGQSTPAPATPKVESAKVVAPTFTAPRRAF